MICYASFIQRLPEGVNLRLAESDWPVGSVTTPATPWRALRKGFIKAVSRDARITSTRPESKQKERHRVAATVPFREPPTRADTRDLFKSASASVRLQLLPDATILNRFKIFIKFLTKS